MGNRSPSARCVLVLGLPRPSCTPAPNAGMMELPEVAEDGSTIPTFTT